MNWSLMKTGVALVSLCCFGGFASALSAPPEVAFIPNTPARGPSEGHIAVVVEYKNAPGAALLEITIYRSVRCLGLLVPVPLEHDTYGVELPKGAYGVTFDGLPTGCPVTHALVEVKDKAGVVIARKLLDGLQVIVP